MAKHFLILLVVVAFAMLLVQGEKLYPDWSCHPGFDAGPNPVDGYTGERLTKLVMEICERKVGCFKYCVIRWHRIVSAWGEKELKSEAEIAAYLKRNIFNADGKDSAEKIAKKIATECSKHEFANLLCDKQAGFFECLEKAWAC